jgi:hypothetical protein
MPDDAPNILQSLEDDPRNWMLKLPKYQVPPTFGLRVPSSGNLSAHRQRRP